MLLIQLLYGSFDETVGYWKEQGTAIKSGNKYIAEVTHFSWWNCDLPLDYVNVCFNLRTHAELANYYVEIIRNENNQMIFSGYTNNQGEECGLFPANEEVTIKVYSDCLTSVLYEEVVGSFSSDTSIEIIIPPVSDIIETNIAATLNNCSGNPITNGYAMIIEGNNQNIFSSEVGVLITNGELDYNVSHCTGSSYNLMVYDFTSGTSTDVIPLTLNGGDYDLGIISTCTTFGGVYDGALTLSTQEEVNKFGLFGFTEITGRFMLRNDNAPSDISDLSPLSSLNSLGENLNIISNSMLTSLYGLHNITSIGGALIVNSNENVLTLGLESLTTIGTHMWISSNDSLITMNGLEGLTSIGQELRFYENDSLTSLAGLEGINNVGGNVSINGNLLLLSLTGLDNLTTIGGFFAVLRSDSLTSLVGIENLVNVENKVYISANTSLLSLTGLESLVTVGDKIEVSNNNVLSSLAGLESLNSVAAGIYIGRDQIGSPLPNPNLLNFCSLTNLITNGVYGSFNANYNQYNPTVQNIIDGNCAQ